MVLHTAGAWGDGEEGEGVTFACHETRTPGPERACACGQRGRVHAAREGVCMRPREEKGVVRCMRNGRRAPMLGWHPRRASRRVQGMWCVCGEAGMEGRCFSCRLDAWDGQRMAREVCVGSWRRRPDGLCAVTSRWR